MGTKGEVFVTVRCVCVVYCGSDRDGGESATGDSRGEKGLAVGHFHSLRLRSKVIIDAHAPFQVNLMIWQQQGKLSADGF
jgi:hypothetical protein